MIRHFPTAMSHCLYARVSMKGVICVEINVREDRKIVDIWLTNEEKNDPTVRERLKEMCNGTMTIDSKPNDGTKVVLRIPVSEEMNR